MTNKVFPFITKSHNPLGGQCPHSCAYCWRHTLVQRFSSLRERYLGEPWLDINRLKPEKNPNDFIFLCDMTDLMGANVCDDIILRVLGFVRESKAKFLIQTKNPKRFFDFLDAMPSNVVLGSSVESNRNYSYLAHGPTQTERLEWMVKLREVTDLPLFIAAEPLLDFDLDVFLKHIRRVNPWSVVVGYDNYNHKLPEPSIEKTLRFIDSLRDFTIIHEKTLRSAWWEQGTEDDQISEPNFSNPLCTEVSSGEIQE